MNWVVEYNAKLISGEIVAGKRIKAVYSKLCREIENTSEDYPYYFDEATGERPIIFIETFCKQSQGQLGADIKLDLWQKAFAQALFGFLEKESGYRRFRETLLLVGRKNGKSTLMAGIALYMLVADGEGAAEIYSVATKKDQAKKVLNEAVNMIRQSPELRAVIRKRRYDVCFPATASVFEALASDSNTLDGLNSHAVIIDELHAIRDRNLYDVMQQSTSARRQPLVIMITTNGTLRECIYDDMYRGAADIVDGKAEDDAFLAVLYEMDERDEWTVPAMWAKANPGLGTIKVYATLARNVARAMRDNRYRPTVLTKDFNITENGSEGWLNFEQIYNPSTFDPVELTDTYAIGGCDLSATTDLTCATLLIRKSKDDPIIYVMQQYFLPKSRIEELDEKSTEEAPYKAWAERKLLTICDGNRVNFSDVTSWFVRMRDTYKIDVYKLAYDRALAGYWVDEMVGNGFNMEKVIQGPFTFTQPMREMGASLEAKLINYNANPVLVWCLSNTGAEKSGENNIRPIKISEKRRIDGMVSLLNAYVVYVRDQNDYMYWVG